MNPIFTFVLVCFMSSILLLEKGLAQPETGLPVWPLTFPNQSTFHFIIWTEDSTAINVISNSGSQNNGQTGAAFDGCGNLVFFAIHTGSSNPNNLNIYAPDGTTLLSTVTSNGPGLNAVRGEQEVQVVRVPGHSNEWYIIYNEWSTDVGSPINNAGYNLAHQLYSRVRFSNGALEVLERDIVLTDGAGNAHKYNDGKAVSRTMNGNINGHYLYACRRVQGDPNISIDRFIISNDEIVFDANTGNVNVGWWDLTGAGSPTELSPTEEKIAVMNRNPSSNYDDIIVFDANLFNNSSIQIISGGDLILVPDGNANDFSNILNYSAAIETVANDNGLNLTFLKNFEKKFQDIEFSPNGRFLYVAGGGFAEAGSTHLTYLAQVDLDAAPLEVRLQIQQTPNGIYDADTGEGCQFTNNSACYNQRNHIRSIQSCYDGNLYFTKGVDNILYVIPDPSNIMPQNLVPSEVDLSTSNESNHVLPGNVLLLPDQIDGFDYLDGGYREVGFVVDRKDCFGNCEAPYVLELSNGGNVIDTFQVNTCPDTLTVCVDTTLVYDLKESITGLTYSGAITFSEVVYPPSEIFFDFSEYLPLDTVFMFGETCNPNQTGIFCQTLTSIYGCDSVICDSIVFNPLDTTFHTDVTCNPAHPDITYQILSNSLNCDSVIATTWTFEPLDTVWLSEVDTCEGVLVSVFGLNVLSDTVVCTASTTIQGCDSVTCVQVNFTPMDTIFYTVSTCDSALVGVQVETFGCDSIVSVETVFQEPQEFEYDFPTCLQTQVGTETMIYGCDSIVFYNYFFSPLDTVTLPKIQLCEGDSISAFGELVSTSGRYCEVNTTPLGCDSVVCIDIDILPLPIVDITPNFDTIALGQNISLDLEIISGGFSQIIWSQSGSLDCYDNDCLTVMAAPIETTEYVVGIMGENGCETKVSSLIEVVNIDRRIFIPDAFSPNGDGINDTFTIFAEPDVLIIESFRIFDRWGAKVFEHHGFEPNDPSLGWDGKHKGQVMNPGFFVFYAEILWADGKAELIKGDVNLVR